MTWGIMQTDICLEPISLSNDHWLTKNLILWHITATKLKMPYPKDSILGAALPNTTKIQKYVTEKKDCNIALLQSLASHDIHEASRQWFTSLHYWPKRPLNLKISKIVPKEVKISFIRGAHSPSFIVTCL